MNVLLAACLAATAASAGTVTVEVHGPGGVPVADAVVTVSGPRAPAGPIRFPWPMVVKQHNIAFEPHVLIAPVGSTVAFPNLDNVRHHVYSFSRPKKFELKLYGFEGTRTVTFDKPGVVAIGCNIHDRMSAFVVVVDTPYAARTDTAGRATIAGVPDGAATLRIWSPTFHAPDNILQQSLTIPAGGVSKIVAAP